MVEHHRQHYGTPLADQPDPRTGLTPNEEQVDRNRKLATALDRLHGFGPATDSTNCHPAERPLE